MRTKKAYIILIAIIIIFSLVVFLVFGLDNIKKEGYKTTIILGEDGVLSLENNSWSYDSNFAGLNWKKYDVYINNEKVGRYYLWHNNKWYAFDNSKNAVILDEGDLLAINSNIDVPVYNFSTDDIDDYTYVYEVLENNGISKTNDYTSSHKIVFDYDNDGEDEEFYIVSNAFPLDFDPDKIFSLVFMVKNEEIYPIYTDVSDNSGLNGCKPYFNAFLDVDNDSKYELILSCAEYSVSNTNTMLYKFENKEFKKLISNNK